MNEQHQPAFFADAAPPPDLGARLSRFIVRRALGARREALAREFGITELEVHRLLVAHGEPPRVISTVARAS